MHLIVDSGCFYNVHSNKITFVLFETIFRILKCTVAMTQQVVNNIRVAMPTRHFIPFRILLSSCDSGDILSGASVVSVIVLRTCAVRERAAL